MARTPTTPPDRPRPVAGRAPRPSPVAGRTPRSRPGPRRAAPRRGRTPLRRLVLLLCLGLLLAACSADDAAEQATGDADRTSGELAGPAGPDAEQAEEPAFDDAAGAPPVPDDGQAPDGGHADDGEAGTGPGDLRPISATLGRRVIRTAEIELQLADPEAAAAEVIRVADRAGGFVATTDLRRDDDRVLRGTITLRVPSDDLLDVLGDLEDLAVSAPLSRIDERDVTTETADLEARRTNLTTYEEELRTLLADVREDTSSPDDLLRIFERIREVRAEIDQIEGRLASLADQVDLATVTVRLTPASSALPVGDPAWEPRETLHEALAAASRGLSRIVDAGIWLGVGVLPVTAAVVLPVAVVALTWRRLRRQSQAPTPTG
jgi:hypothetical protein